MQTDPWQLQTNILNTLRVIQEQTNDQSSSVLVKYYCLARLVSILDDSSRNQQSQTHPALNQLFDSSSSFENMCYPLRSLFHSSSLASVFDSLLWRLDITQIGYKKCSKFFEVFNSWVTYFEDSISQPQNYDRCLVLIRDFLKSHTVTFYERVVFIEQAYDDLRSAIKYKYFWEDQNPNLALQTEQAELYEAPSSESFEALLQMLNYLVYRKELMHNGQYYSNPLLESLHTAASDYLKYQHFIYRALLYLFSNDKLVQASPKDLCRLSLLFALISTHDDFTLNIVNKVLIQIPKMVRFAYIHDFQEVYALLEHKGRYQLAEQLDKLQDYRQLILKKVDKTFNESEHMSYEHSIITVLRGSTQKIYFEITKPRSLLFFEFLVDSDISINLTFEGNLDPVRVCSSDFIPEQVPNSQYSSKQKHRYLAETKQRSRCYQLEINDCGLHSIQFDNSYSWITSKNIQYSFEVFRPAKGTSHSFNGLTFGHQEYTRWVGYSGVRVSAEEEGFGDIWEDYLPTQMDMVVWGDRVFVEGKVYHIKCLNWQKYREGAIENVLVGGNRERYEQLTTKLRELNPQVSITFKKSL